MKIGVERIEDAREDRNERPSAQWPDPIDPAAYHGLAGDVVHTIEPHSEADPVALLLSFGQVFGNAVGRGPHTCVEADRHACNLNVVLVGNTAKGRKGTSWGHVRRIFSIADPPWTAEHVQHGLSSGEGLIHAVRDPVEKEQDGEIVVVDEGVADKRLFVFEAEFASVLKVATRQGNTLSALLRQAWDGSSLQTMTRNSPLKATDPHVSILGHVTADELRRTLGETECASGFANRFLFVCVKRSKTLPEGGNLDDRELEQIAQRVRETLEFARSVERVDRDEDARQLWIDVYPDLSKAKPGLLGAMIARSEAQVLRLSVLYALLDRSVVVRVQHLEAALAVWRFCENSTRFVFGDALGDPVADTILKALRGTADGLDRTAISGIFARNQTRFRIDAALHLLARNGLARSEPDRSGTGRAREVWKAL